MADRTAECRFDLINLWNFIQKAWFESEKLEDERPQLHSRILSQNSTRRMIVPIKGLTGMRRSLKNGTCNRQGKASIAITHFKIPASQVWRLSEQAEPRHNKMN